MIWDRASAEVLGEMHTIESDQYGCACVVVFPGDTADKVIEHCQRMRALCWLEADAGDEPDFCVVLRHDIGPELYSESALRRSLPIKNATEGQR